MAFNPVQVGGIDTDRYGVKFNADYLWVPVIANANGTPTEVEINNGRLLTAAIAAINGFNVSPRYDELPDLVSVADPKVAAGSSVDDSAMSFYLATDDDDSLDFFTLGDDGYIIHCPRGLVGGARAFTWKVEVSVALPTVAMTGGSMGAIGFGTFGAPKKIDLPTET